MHRAGERLRPPFRFHSPDGAFMRLRIALAFALLSATSAFAVDAVTYKGTIGKIPVILEMAEGTDSGTFAARYAYRSKGIDIPLHGTLDLDDGIRIEEEAPCTDTICKGADGNVLEVPPIGADWTLESSNDEQQLNGTWKDRKSGKSLLVMLTRVGSRSLGDSKGESVDDLDPSSAAREATTFLTPKDLPYDFLKLDHKVKQGPETVVDGATIRMDTDPFTATSYPTILKLPGADTRAINTWLRQQWLQLQFNPYYCKSKLYLGYGWWGNEVDGSNGFWDDGPGVTINYLSPRLLGLSESGSFFCGGAYPNHFIDYRFAEVATGKPIVAESLLKGFVLKNSSGEAVDPAKVGKDDYVKYGPNAELVTFINDRRNKSDASVENDCMMGDLVQSNLGVYFTRDELVFNLKGLPHVIFACGDDLVRVPSKEARPLLNDEGVRLLLGG
jgi:hypothetical protein